MNRRQRGLRPAPLTIGRTAYSFLRGTAKPGRLVAAAAEQGYPALALADRENLCAAVEFLEAARGRRLRPVLGAELVLPLQALRVAAGRDKTAAAGPQAASRGARLAILCRDVTGYRNLCRLLSRFHLTGVAAAAAYLLSGPPGWCVLSEDPEVWPLLRESFAPDDLGARLTRPAPWTRQKKILEQALCQSVRLIASSDAFMITREEESVRRLLGAIRRHALLGAEAEGLGKGGRDARRREMPGLLVGAQELSERFRDLPEALNNAAAVVERCTLTLDDLAPGRFILPSIRGREGPRVLRGLCEEGLSRRRLEHAPEARRRLDRELAVIETLGFTDYFLVVGDIVAWARARGIRLIGRGSGAASIVAYLLGVTNVDPLRARLCFERFFHPLRRDLPDLDIDIAWDRREEVLRHALTRFGVGRAAMMGTHAFFRARGAFREAARALGLAEAQIAAGAHRLPHGFFGERVGGVDPLPGAGGRRAPEARAAGAGPAAGEDRRALEALARRADAAVRRAARAALGLLDLPRHLGTHPAGVVLADRPLEELVALQRSPGGLPVTQLEMRAAERLGLVKIDLLGNRALGTIDETVRLLSSPGPTSAANARRVAPAGANPDPPVAGAAPGECAGAPGGVDLESIPHEDERTARLLAGAETLGCLQLESPAMRTLLTQLEARDLDALVAAIALIRPGPAGSGMKQAFIRRARGMESPEALHPLLGPVLATTFGLPLYDEDVIAMAAAVSGGSLAEGDLLRRAVIESVRRAKRGEPLAERELALLERGLLAAARARGIDERAARCVWEALVRFAAYSFCKAHAAGYGVLAYQCAWLKAHFPGPFFAALLNHQRGMYPLRVYVDDARRHGLALRAPCVARGGAVWRWEPRDGGPGTLRCGLAAVRGLRGATLHAILAERAQGRFRDLADFASRVPANAPELEGLVLCGAFDEAFGLVRGELVWRLHRWLRRRRSPSPVAEGAAGATGVQESLPFASLPGRVSGTGGRAGHPGDRAGAALPPGREESSWRSIAVRQRAQLERRLLGVSLALHPTALAPESGDPREIPIAAARLLVGQPVSLRAIVSALRRVRDSRGRPLLFVTLEDASGLLEGVLRSRDGGGHAEVAGMDAVLAVRGTIRAHLGAAMLEIQDLRLLGHV